MRFVLRLAWVLFFLSIAGFRFIRAEEVKEEPLADEVIFSLTFDKGDIGSNARIAVGKGSSLKVEDGIKGKALLIGGGGSFLRIEPGIYIGSGAGSLTCWISPVKWTKVKPEKGALRHIFWLTPYRQFGGYMGLQRHFDYAGNDKLMFWCLKYEGISFPGLISAIKNWQEGEWHFVVFNWRVRKFELVVDGNLIPREISRPLSEEETNPMLAIGGNAEGVLQSSEQSLIDEIRIYERALTLEEIKELMTYYQKGK